VERTEEDLAEVAGEGNDVAKGMSQFGGQRHRLNPKITIRRGDSNLP
jgi:hypothetical protein